jgi:phosphoglycolate phosphatase-like HAD superfamily hydrolase
VTAAIFSEDALASTDRLWADAVAHLSRKLGRVTPLDPDQVPADRAAAIDYLDGWAGDDARSWRVEAARFFEDHVPVYLRPDPELNAALRHIQSQGLEMAAWSPGPPEAALVVTHFLGLARRFTTQAVDPAPGAAARVAAELGMEPADTLVVSASPATLLEAKASGARTAGALWTGGNRELLLAAMPTLLAESPGELVGLALTTR